MRTASPIRIPVTASSAIIVAGDKDRAIRWFRAAAERGDTYAMTNLALVIDDDDREAALDWTRRALALGAGLTTRYNLATLVEETGRPHEALSLYRHAARRGQVEAAQEAVRLKRAGLGPRPSISRDQ